MRNESRENANQCCLPGADSGLRMDITRGMMAGCKAILGIARRRALCVSTAARLGFSAVEIDNQTEAMGPF